MEDTSIFQGVVEFEAPDGRQIRATKTGSVNSRGRGLYEIFVKRGGSFVRERAVKVSGQATPATITAAMRKAEYEDD